MEFKDYLSDFGEWLKKHKKYNKNVVSSRISNVKALSEQYDILKEYSTDECESILDELQYSRKDTEPKTSIVINGDYYNALATYRNALRLAVEYLKHIGYGAPAVPKATSAKFVGDFDEFKRYVGPKCRNEVNIFCKSERAKHHGICEYCGKKAVLQSAHIKERPVIIQEILDNHYRTGLGMNIYEVPLDEFFVKFKDAHMPIPDHIFFLCKDCHDELDKKHSISVADIQVKRSGSKSPGE
jgi:hypothetical protein